jgi:hypothetical protein
LRFWPQKKWKKILLTALLVLLTVLLSMGGYLEYSVYREVSTQTVVLNFDGVKTALLIYHPGITDFARNVTYSFADGLASGGWRVEIATASPQAPVDLSNYSLLVLAWPIYDFNPGPTITNQIHRMGNLNDTATVIIVVAGGMDPFKAQTNMEKIVQNANGTLLETLQAFRGGDAWITMQEEASEITP